MGTHPIFESDFDCLTENMKISLALLGLVSAGEFMTKEWEVAEAYYKDEPIVLQDPDDERSRNKQWHDCGDKPATPANGRDVVCNGKWCATICKQGFKSEGRWRIKCMNNNTWNHPNLSKCISCPNTPKVSKTVNEQTAFHKNLQVKSYFCPRSTDTLHFFDKNFKKGGKHKKVKCMCRKGQGNDPAWKNSCSCKFGKNDFTDANFKSMKCIQK